MCSEDHTVRILYKTTIKAIITNCLSCFACQIASIKCTNRVLLNVSLFIVYLLVLYTILGFIKR